MKSRGPLLMIEQLIMTLVFALATALFLRCFALAHEISVQTERQDEAVKIAQNVAEQLKAGRTPELEDLAGDYVVTVQEESGEGNGLREAGITVEHAGEVLFQLNTGWQEEAQ